MLAGCYMCSLVFADPALTQMPALEECKIQTYGFHKDFGTSEHLLGASLRVLDLQFREPSDFLKITQLRMQNILCLKLKFYKNIVTEVGCLLNPT